MRVVPCVVLMVGVCLGLGGCELFNRRPAGNNFAPGGGNVGVNVAVGPKKGEPVDPLNASPTVDTAGFLAGQVIIKQTGLPPAESYVLFSCAEDSNDKGIDVKTDAFGNFTIQGLKPGRHYKLIARGKQGNRLLAGTAFYQTPNIRAIIRVSEDQVSPNTPPLPDPPAFQPKKKEKKDDSKKPAATGAEQASAQVPVWEVPTVQVQVPDSARPTVKVQPSPQQRWETVPYATKPTPAVDPNRIAGAEVPKWRPPPVVIPSPVPKTAPELPKPWVPSSQQSSVNPPPSSSAAVPSCLLVGRQLVNFTLLDLNGQPWIYRERKRGKLVLLDFWATHCPPCRRAIPDLVALQSKYGPAGLEVIGIAYEASATMADQAEAVRATAQKLGINYPLLLAQSHCPVQRDFFVRVLPTLVLIDENGWTSVWRHEGALDANTLQSLERAIRIRLGGN